MIIGPLEPQIFLLLRLLQAPCVVLYSESNEEKSSAPSAYTVGEKIKVWYGKGKFLKCYVAKVSATHTDNAHDIASLVH